MRPFYACVAITGWQGTFQRLVRHGDKVLGGRAFFVDGKCDDAPFYYRSNPDTYNRSLRAIYRQDWILVVRAGLMENFSFIYQPRPRSKEREHLDCVSYYVLGHPK